MYFEKAAKLGSFISKDYAKDIFRLLFHYKSISASEAASRLDLHIQTVQEFLETLAGLDFLSKEIVHEHKRPYNRYSLKKTKIKLEIDLNSLFEKMDDSEKLSEKIREKKDARVRFSFSRDSRSISAVVIWIGKGRSRKERKINLTAVQGNFLFHLPFPSAPHLSIQEIMQRAGIKKSFMPEILDLVELLKTYQVIETV